MMITLSIIYYYLEGGFAFSQEEGNPRVIWKLTIQGRPQVFALQ
jgi:hypothetical protein